MNNDDKNDPDKDYEVGYGKPPKNHQFVKGQSGNPRGRPKNSDRPLRMSMDTVRAIIMNAAHKTVEVRQNGQRKLIPKFALVMDNLFSKAASGNVAAAKEATRLLRAAASENDRLLFQQTEAFFALANRRDMARQKPGTLECYEGLYAYFMMKKEMRFVEGEENWPYELDEPRTAADWQIFNENHEYVRSNPGKKTPWPPTYPSEEDILLSDNISADEHTRNLIESFIQSRKEDKKDPDDAD